VGVGPIDGHTEPHGPDQVTGDGNQWQRQVRGPRVAVRHLNDATPGPT
jgi:hypothetical protein